MPRTTLEQAQDQFDEWVESLKNGGDSAQAPSENDEKVTSGLIEAIGQEAVDVFLALNPEYAEHRIGLVSQIKRPYSLSKSKWEEAKANGRHRRKLTDRRDRL